METWNVLEGNGFSYDWCGQVEASSVAKARKLAIIEFFGGREFMEIGPNKQRVKRPFKVTRA